MLIFSVLCYTILLVFYVPIIKDYSNFPNPHNLNVDLIELPDYIRHLWVGSLLIHVRVWITKHGIINSIKFPQPVDLFRADFLIMFICNISRPRNPDRSFGES